MGNVPSPNLFPGVAKSPGITEIKPPALEAPATTFPPPGGTGFTKPAGATEVKPNVTEVKPNLPERAPKTSYDVDIYDAKDGDTYESISLEWYNNKQFAASLRAYNQNHQLQGGRYVNIPPKHILQRQFSAPTGGTSGARTSPPATDAPNWSSTPATRPSGRTTFIVPRNGMTPKQIAQETMGTEQRWRDIYDLNPRVKGGDELLPAGTELRLPDDAKRP